ncbi:MAG: DUF2799 domain-containing protein [Kiloniellales bacterium]|nr:DUF2799 domain-containing protein [Kiloniellales bacterium]
MRPLFLLLFLLAVSGCSGMSAEECSVADWRAIGYEDGAKGLSPQAFGQHRRACAEHGVAADFDGYLAGRKAGLAHYCRPQNGYSLGARGRRYSGVCPTELEADFLAAHAEGFGLYERRRELNRIGQELDRARARADEIEHLVAENTALLISPGIPPSERAALVIELKQLAEEKITVEESILDLEYDYAAAERALDDYRAAIATRPAD